MEPFKSNKRVPRVITNHFFLKLAYISPPPIMESTINKRSSMSSTTTSSSEPTKTRYALVTGGSSGIGIAVVTKLLQEGYHVLTTGRNEERLKEAFTTYNLSTGVPNHLHFITADLSTNDGPSIVMNEVKRLFPVLHVLVNNAGSGNVGQQIERASMALFDNTMTLNVRSPFALIQLAVPYFVPKESVVVNLSSVAAQRPFNGMGPYCISKAAVDMLTQSAALELAPKQIRVVGIAPGTIETSFHEHAGMSKETAQAYYSASAHTHPIGRVGNANEIGDIIMFVIDPVKASFITGSTFVVDGGRLLTSSTAPQLGGGGGGQK